MWDLLWLCKTWSDKHVQINVSLPHIQKSTNARNGLMSVTD